MRKSSSPNCNIRKYLVSDRMKERSKNDCFLSILTDNFFRFLVNMNYAFEDRDNLYLVIDIMSGGDLRYHIGRHRRFSEIQTSK